MLRRKKPKYKNINKKNSGYMLIILLVFSGIFVILLAASAAYVISQAQVANFKTNQQKILEIAEAGANYYLWHLAHVPNDFTDDTEGPGPYLHDYQTASGEVIGQYSLNIIPPAVGSTVATIESTGYLINQPNISRTIVVKIGIPSFSNYAIIADDELYFNNETESWGPIHSNDGIRFDGYAHSLVTSSMDRYIDHTHEPEGPPEYGVHTHIPPRDERPPAPLRNRPDVFGGGRSFPVPPVDFDGITSDLAILREEAIENGIYLTESDEQGYHVHFNSNHTLDITKVTSQLTCRWLFVNHWMSYDNVASIAQEEPFTYQGQSSQGLSMPPNGLIFIQDDVWIDGQIDHERVTVVSAEDPLANKKGSIHINQDLRYTNYDGSDAVGLIAADNIWVGLFSADDLRIDASVVAQNGTVQRVFYPDRTEYQQDPPNCAENVYRHSITTFGSVASKKSYGFAYPDGTGYQSQSLNYDPNLTFSPPPGFPTYGEFTIVSWEEL